MATKLKNLKIKKVDFVDEGANPDARIGMVKRKDGEQADGKNRGESPGFVSRLLGFIGKAAGMGQDEIDSALDEIQKSDSASFDEKISEKKNWKIMDEIWDTCSALQSSLCSILNDGEKDGASTATAMQESLDEFTAFVQESIKNWSSGEAVNIAKKSDEVTEADLAIMKSAVLRLQADIEKASKDTEEEPEDPGNGGSGDNNPKGDEEEMKIDKSKLTDEEKAFLDDIEKRCGAEGGEAAPQEAEPGAGEQEEAVNKSSGQAQEAGPGADGGDEPDDIYKGLHPAVKAELESLKKFRDAAEEKELEQVAGKYEIIGKKREELAPLLKSLKAAGGTAYDDMIAILDQTVETVEKSGAFSEIGKSGRGYGYVAGQAEQKAEAIAKGYMEKDASLGYAAAMAKVWECNPNLFSEYEEEEGF